jgi:hypothetical protein
MDRGRANHTWDGEKAGGDGSKMGRQSIAEKNLAKRRRQKRPRGTSSAGTQPVK